MAVVVLSMLWLCWNVYGGAGQRDNLCPFVPDGKSWGCAMLWAPSLHTRLFQDSQSCLGMPLSRTRSHSLLPTPGSSQLHAGCLGMQFPPACTGLGACGSAGPARGAAPTSLRLLCSRDRSSGGQGEPELKLSPGLSRAEATGAPLTPSAPLSPAAARGSTAQHARGCSSAGRTQAPMGAPGQPAAATSSSW